MISEAITHARRARDGADRAIEMLSGGGADSAAPELAGAVEELCAALTELAWAECDRAVYGEDVK